MKGLRGRDAVGRLTGESTEARPLDSARTPMSVYEGEGLGCQSRMDVRQAPLSSALIRGLPLPQPLPFQGCVGELPSRCAPGVPD